VVQHAERVGQQRERADRDEHDGDLPRRRGFGRVGGREQAGPDDAEGDREHARVLVAAGLLVQHALAGDHQHQQPGRERGLHDDKRREHQRHDLQREPEDRHARAEEPAAAPHEPPRKREAQVRVLGRLLGIHRLERDP